MAAGTIYPLDDLLRGGRSAEEGQYAAQAL
jgi:hypothetical protein